MQQQIGDVDLGLLFPFLKGLESAFVKVVRWPELEM